MVMRRRATLLFATLASVGHGLAPAYTMRLGDTSVVPVSAGATAGAALAAGSLWRERGAVVFAVRRPG